MPAVVDMDRHVGERVRLRRNMQGMSQEALGALIGLTFQQVQKYERGANRISASRLHEIAQALEVPIAFFYDDRDSVHAPPVVEPVRVDDPMTQPDAQAMLAAYQQLPSARLRGYFMTMLRGLVAEEEPEAVIAKARRATAARAGWGKRRAAAE